MKMSEHNDYIQLPPLKKEDVYKRQKQDRVDMRMKVHFRSPGLKDTDITCRCTKIFWVSGQVIYGCRSSVIKNIVK